MSRQDQLIHVLVGVIHHQDNILIAKRPAHKPLGGYWEFPGGKLEPGELPRQALARELLEECDIRIITATPFMQLNQGSNDKPLLLDVWHVNAFAGIPKALESDEIRWVARKQLADYSFPPLNQQILDSLNVLC